MIGSFKKLGNEFIGALFNNKVGRGLNPFPVPLGGVSEYNPLKLFNKEQLGKLAKMSFKDIGQDVSSYFQGKNLIPSSEGLIWGAADKGAASIRRTAGGLAGGLITAHALDINPFGATSAATDLAMLGGHGAAGYAMTKMAGRGPRLAGYGYLAATVINTFRGGDNLGPM